MPELVEVASIRKAAKREGVRLIAAADGEALGFD